MNAKTEDRRIRKTKQALKSSLAVLLEQKDIRDISVQELASLADLNRTTFYLHYKDIYDLQQQIENEAAGKINEILMEYMPLKGHEQIYRMLAKFLTCIKEDADLHHIILGKNKTRCSCGKYAAAWRPTASRCGQRPSRRKGRRRGWTISVALSSRGLWRWLSDG